MPKVKTLKSFSGAFGSFSNDSEVEFPEEHIEEYVKIGYIQLIGSEKEPENIENNAENTGENGTNEGKNGNENPENVINTEENVIKEPESEINQEQADKKAGKNKNTTQK